MPEVKIEKIEIKIDKKTLTLSLEPVYPVVTYPVYTHYPPYYEYTYTAGGNVTIDIKET